MSSAFAFSVTVSEKELSRMKVGHLINSIIAVCLVFIAGNQILVAGSLEPPLATVAPTMKSLEQIFDQQRFAAFAGGSIRSGPGIITSADPAGTGTFLGQLNIDTPATGFPSLTIQNLGDCDVRIDSTNTDNANTPTVTVRAGQSYSDSAMLADSGQFTGAQGTYTFLGGTDCQFMWVVR